MFRAQSAHHQEVNDANCTYAACGIVTLCKRLSCATAKEKVLCVVDLLMMGGLRSKQAEGFNLM
jgi:hypothetical protein